MGQTVIGVMWGVEVPDGVDLYDEDDCANGLLERWESRCKAEIDALAEQLMPLHRNSEWRARRAAETRFLPRHESNGSSVVGFWIARGPYAESGVPALLDSMPIFALKSDEPYRKVYRRARRAWRRFASWAAEQGVDLPKPTLIISPTEVA